MSNLSQSDKQTLDNYNGMSVGTIFRTTREGKGYDLKQIAEHLNIGSDHLHAIEVDDYGTLPQKVYAVGFVRAYADLLELDAEKMAYLFKVQAYGKKQAEHQKQIVKTEGKTIGIVDLIATNKGVIPMAIATLSMIILVIAAIVFFIMWLLSPSDDDESMRVPAVPATMLEGGMDAESGLLQNDPDENTPMPIEPMDLIVQPDEGGQVYGVDALESALTLKMLGETFVEIRAVEDGQILLSQELSAGDVFYVAEDQDILLSSNNGGNIEVYLDGQKLGTLGNDGDSVRVRPFSVKALRLQRGE